jgi:hypothetical protein
MMAAFSDRSDQVTGVLEILGVGPLDQRTQVAVAFLATPPAELDRDQVPDAGDRDRQSRRDVQRLRRPMTSASTPELAKNRSTATSSPATGESSRTVASRPVWSCTIDSVDQ